MQNSIIVSDNDTRNLTVISRQTVLNKDFTVYGSVENPLFLAKDVATWIDHSDVSTMLRSVDEDEKVTNIVCTLGGNQKSWFITENGLYEVLMLSRKPIAKQFKKEVKKILHQIRLTGGYTIPRTFADALRLAAEQQERIALMQPKADVYDRICNSETLKPVDQVASNLGYGKNNFFALLRGMGIFYYSSKDVEGKRVNLPKQEYKDRGYFVTKEEPYSRGDKDCLYTKIYVTGKGETWLTKKLTEDVTESFIEKGETEYQKVMNETASRIVDGIDGAREQFISDLAKADVKPELKYGALEQFDTDAQKIKKHYSTCNGKAE